MISVEEVQVFVRDRILELLNKATLDSYRVRINNVYTSLLETRHIIKRYGEMKVKTFETVSFLVQETIDLLKVDDCLQFTSYDKDLFINELVPFSNQNPGKCPNLNIGRILFCLEKCIEENHTQYLTKLYAKLDTLLANVCEKEEDVAPYLEKIDATVSALCVQLIFEGFDKRFLYTELKYYSGKPFREFLRTFHNFGKKRQSSFEIIWPLFIKDSDPHEIQELGFKTEANLEHINAVARDKYKKIIAPARNHYFFQDYIRSLDRFSAVRASRERLMQRFDGIHLGYYSKTLSMPANALVTEKKPSGWFTKSCVADYFLDGAFTEGYELSSRLISSLETIYSSTSIDSSAKDRIKSAIRHLNYGDLDSEIEQRFINYWIALEFIFASPQTNENTFTRLKSYLIDVLSVSYVKRNVMYITDKLMEMGIITANDDIWQSKESIDAVANKPELPLLWKYRLKQMKSRLFTQHDKMKKYDDNHVKNLERHIVRIYNLRNVLIHEGAIKQDVEDLTSNLRYYLVFIIDQMIGFFTSKASEKKKTYQIDFFFNEYRSYRKQLEHNLTLENLLTVPVCKSLW